MKKLKIILTFIVACTYANAQSLKQSKISYGALQSKQTNDCINRNAIKTLHAKQMLPADAGLKNMQLVSAYPNPFNDNINILMNYQQQGFVKLDAYNAMGALIYVGNLATVNTGASTITYELKNLPTGLYLFKVFTYDLNQTLTNQYAFKSLKIN